MNRYKYFDISPIVSEKTGVFPGDVPFTRNVSLQTAKGDNITLSDVRSTLHIGAHADAPVHYRANGLAIHEVDLSIYCGPCQVVRVAVGRGERVYPHHIKQKIVVPRVLIFTGSFPDPNVWNSDFASLSPELIDYLATCQVVLVGLDTPSVDPEGSKSLESHAALFKTGLLPLEGLVLAHVPEGVYTLVALPLALLSADASPVRAMLIPSGEALV